MNSLSASQGTHNDVKRINLTCHVLYAPLELELPVVDVLDPLAELLGDVVLRAVRPRRAVADQLLGLVANAA